VYLPIDILQRVLEDSRTGNKIKIEYKRPNRKKYFKRKNIVQMENILHKREQGARQCIWLEDYTVPLSWYTDRNCHSPLDKTAMSFRDPNLSKE